MLGGYLEYDVDLSGVGCGCNTAFYGLLMPGLDNTSDPFMYCDGGTYGAEYAAACPEFDIMEANKWGFRSTSHKCPPADDEGVFSNCDHTNNCSVDFLTDAENAYGPGSSYSIDTTKPFTVRADYQESDGKWVAFTITLSQSENSVVLSHGDCPYLNEQSEQINRGMNFIMSCQSQDNQDWLQHGTCTEQCDTEN